MLKIKNFSVNIAEKKLLDNISISFEKDKTYAIIWKNWAGKSTLINAIMWNPNYNISGQLFLSEEEITNKSPSDKALSGIFLAFQNIPEIPWIKLWTFLREVYNTHLKQNKPEINPLSPLLFGRFIKKYLEQLKLDENILERDLNVWFSWWEKRKLEMLQIILFTPQYIFIDEIDSGLDIDAINLIWDNLKNIKNQNNSIIIISHNLELLNKTWIDIVLLLNSWKIEKVWDNTLLQEIKNKWFNS